MLGGMSISVAQMQEHLDAARAAIVAGDYATAEVQALAAQTCLAGIPNGQQAGDEIAWRETIESLLNNIRRLKDAAALATASADTGMIQRTKVTYIRDTEDALD